MDFPKFKGMQRHLKFKCPNNFSYYGYHLPTKLWHIILVLTSVIIGII